MSESPDLSAFLPKAAIPQSDENGSIKLADIQIDGVSAEAAQAGGTVKVWTRLSLTSDDHFFHRVVEGLASHVEHCARKAGNVVNLKRANVVLLVVHSDNTGDLWVDSTAVVLKILAKRDVVAGTEIFDDDVGDITAMAFPEAKIEEKDRVICLFRVGWRFALFFDFNPGASFSLPDLERDLGSLYRRLRYHDLYDTIRDQAIVSRLVAAGWFPFIEILGAEFREIARHCEAGFDLADVEAKILGKFDAARMERMFSRWMAKPHFIGKEQLLGSAKRSFLAGDAVPVLKIVLTEIEGILGEAYRSMNGKGAKLKDLLKFAIESAEQKTGQPDTLFFPSQFAHYLNTHTFANFDPVARTGNASSRHAVGHGAAEASTYTMTRALQALLTLDQLAFYT